MVIAFYPGEECTDWKAIVKNHGIEDVPDDWDGVRALKKTDPRKYSAIVQIVQFRTCNIQYTDRVIPFDIETLYHLKPIRDYVESQEMRSYMMNINSACTLRIGKDLYFSLIHPQLYGKEYLSQVEKLFPDYRCHVIPHAQAY